MQQSNEQNLSKKERKKLLKEQKKLEKQKAVVSKKQKKYLTYGVLIIALGVFGYLGYGYMTKAASFAVPIMNSPHLTSIHQPHEPYNTDPPTSGPHFEGHAEQKISSKLVPKEIMVHELEHGGVYILYNCQDCEDLIAKLEKVARAHDHVLMAPYPEMETRIALTAWGRLAKLNDYDEKLIINFINSFAGKNHGS